MFLNVPLTLSAILDKLKILTCLASLIILPYLKEYSALQIKTLSYVMFKCSIFSIYHILSWKHKSGWRVYVISIFYICVYWVNEAGWFHSHKSSRSIRLFWNSNSEFLGIADIGQAKKIASKSSLYLLLGLFMKRLLMQKYFIYQCQVIIHNNIAG